MALPREVGWLFERGTVAGMGEGALLARFVGRRDEAAFEALVARFGPMVLGVCRRRLGDPHDVEDAFQATFLVLVRKAATIRDGDRLGNWLFGVALRVATRAHARTRRRRAREAVGDGCEAAVSPRESDASLGLELRSLLDEELSRLPESLRAPVVLCHLQGLTYEQAAARLKCPVGTVRSRSSRARGLLRDRLLRRGVALPAVLSAAALISVSAQAAVPPALAGATMSAAFRVVSAGGLNVGAVPASVKVLTREVLRAMLWTKLKWAAAVGLAAAALAGGAGVIASGGRGERAADLQAVDGQPAEGEKAKPDEPSAIPAGEKAKATEQLDLARKALSDLNRLAAGGEITLDNPAFSLWERRQLDAIRNSGADRSRVIEEMERALQVLRKLEQVVNEQYRKDQVTRTALWDVQYRRIEAEIALNREKAGRVNLGLGEGGASTRDDRLAPKGGDVPDNLRKVRPRFDCLVEKVFVKVGQTVKVGDPLAEVFSSELAAAKNDYLAKAVQAHHGQRIFELRERLVKAGSISQQLWVDTQNDRDKSKLDLTVGHDRLAVLYGLGENEIEAIKDEPADHKARFTLRAPIDGTVTRVDARTQDLADPKCVLFEIDTIRP